MRNALVFIVTGFLASIAAPASAPAFGQVISHNLPTPPCTIRTCVSHPRGATLKPPGPSSVQKIACPPGTVYNPSRGTCKVMR